jgi:hypothetical protein
VWTYVGPAGYVVPGAILIAGVVWIVWHSKQRDEVVS